MTVTWYVTRAGGLVGFGLLTLAVVAGLALSGRARLARWPRFAVEDIHRFLGLLAGCFIALHVLVLLVDDFIPFSPLELVLPGLASFRRLPTALGVVGAELLVALALTNRYRQALSYRFWRRAHYASFGVWLLALVHGIGSGSDTDTVWAASLYAVAAGSVAGLVLWRVLRARPIAAWEARLWPGAAAVAAAELILALSLGPLRHHL